MNDSIERVELVLVRENDLTKRGSVETSIIAQDVLAPAADDVLEGLRLGADRFTRELVGVDDGGAAFGEHSRYL